MKFIFFILFLSFTSFAESQVSQKLVNVLNNSNIAFSDETYENTIEKWPNSIPIWNYLKSKDSKLNFIYYVLKRDDTNERTVDSFGSQCTSYSTQFYIRYSKFYKADTEVEIRLKEVMGIDVGNIQAKFKFPVYMVNHFQHFFNGFILYENKKNDVNNVILLEPQTDEIMAKDFDFNESSWHKYAIRYPFTFVHFQNLNDFEQYETRDDFTFVLTGQGNYQFFDNSKPNSFEFVNFLTDFFINESDMATYNNMIGTKTFKDFLKERSKLWNISGSQKLELIKILLGRKVKEKPDSAYITIDSNFLNYVFE